MASSLRFAAPTPAHDACLAKITALGDAPRDDSFSFAPWLTLALFFFTSTLPSPCTLCLNMESCGFFSLHLRCFWFFLLLLLLLLAFSSMSQVLGRCRLAGPRSSVCHVPAVCRCRQPRLASRWSHHRGSSSGFGSGCGCCGSHHRCGRC